MRSELAMLLLVAVPACASAQDKAACAPVASLSSPAFRCGAADPEPEVVAIEEEPEPEPEPEEEPEPEPEPPRVILTTDKIEILDPIQFEASKDVILDASIPTLDAVVQTLTDNPQIKKVRIDGHTDGQGGRKSNQKLSDKRAKAVRAYLIEQGVASKRLTTKGFGEDSPRGDNATPEGRFANRRVEFTILEAD